MPSAVRANTLPSFTLAFSHIELPQKQNTPKQARHRRHRRDDSQPAMPDYYRHTRLEKYQPYGRVDAHAEIGVDLMQTVDERDLEGGYFVGSFLLPDIFEDEEIDIEGLPGPFQYPPIFTRTTPPKNPLSRFFQTFVHLVRRPFWGTQAKIISATA